MKLAIVTHVPRPIPLQGLFQRLAEKAETETFALHKDGYRLMGRFLEKLQLQRFDKVLLDLPFKRLRRHASRVVMLPDVTIYEEDATYNFRRDSHWHSRFSRFYHLMPQVKTINTGFLVSERLKQDGVDSFFVPKGFDPVLLYDQDRLRDIPLGFIGSLRARMYRQRAEALEHMKQAAGLQLFRTQGIDEYRGRLNQIKVFFSADIGLGEYMAKNFEAMACGCLLLAWRQGGGEEEALGLVDGENCLLYGSLSEATEKLAWLQQQPPERLEHMRQSALALVQSRFAIPRMAEAVWQVIQRQPRCKAPDSFWKTRMLPLAQRILP